MKDKYFKSILSKLFHRQSLATIPQSSLLPRYHHLIHRHFQLPVDMIFVLISIFRWDFPTSYPSQLPTTDHPSSTFFSFQSWFTMRFSIEHIIIQSNAFSNKASFYFFTHAETFNICFIFPCPTPIQISNYQSPCLYCYTCMYTMRM